MISQNLVKDIFILLLSYLQLPIRKAIFYFRRDKDDFEFQAAPPEEYRPSPSLVPVPSHLADESIKTQLPIVWYGDSLERRGGGFVGKDSVVCVVCMNNMESGDEVRELCNYCHVFHKECLDVWIGKGQVTCPLCRSKLSPIQREELLLGVDPWRRERMVYLFGEDYVMDTR
jgi:hypothetical protein